MPVALITGANAGSVSSLRGNISAMVGVFAACRDPASASKLTGRQFPGDGVDGYARELVVAPSTAFTHAPKGYSFTEAATLPTAGVTAWRALVVNGALKAGDTVLVLGTGGVSIFALQIAKAMGATVIATSSSDEKLKRVRALGADHTINYRHHPDWGARVREWTGGSGVDHVVEVGGPGTLAQSITAVAIGGYIAGIAIAANMRPATKSRGNHPI